MGQIRRKLNVSKTTFAAAALTPLAAQIGNLRKVGRLDGRRFRNGFDAGFDLDLTLVSNSI